MRKLGPYKNFSKVFRNTCELLYLKIVDIYFMKISVTSIELIGIYLNIVLYLKSTRKMNNLEKSRICKEVSQWN